ncbi:uncharacterized protein Z519_02086 [Cladophialophora bantiana CBS 173.52]|uniref:Integral membrane protein n=1 Tax=Cladophialophora bantiana (strain ATCC 10958 / CBS 173.52 / CDC B-1940 / NIH 8579) TaxID=1442370 RepID=A0A0D2I0J5_CLAB1|nr:uncharacterized protein Z519_02086 [Cladophialophora bantiana CBS 173.52]KIW96695.1 hypothetical protein Z519_02086 [Cladophialophora bantiana CBS 173.52]
MAIFRRSKSDKPVPQDPPSDKVPLGYRKSKPTILRTFTVTVYLLATIFLILVEIGNINNKAVIRSTYFLKIELANIIPASVPNAVFINSIAQSIGLHDFYQVGLWDFCEGYNGEGVTHCSPTKTLYWFNPVQIILDELLAGASITLPAEVVTVLDLVRLASAWMFSCFLIGTCLTFLCVFVSPMGFSRKPRWQHKTRRIFLRQFPVSLLTLAALLFTAVASLIATIMFVIFRDKFSGAADLNIHAHLGKPMFAFMWIATGLDLIGFLVQLGTCCGVCFCTGRKRAVRRSRLNTAGHARADDTEKTLREVDNTPRTDGSSGGILGFRRGERS